MLSNPTRFRRLLAGVACIGAPLSFGAGDVMRLVVHGQAMTSEEQLAAVDAQPALWQTAGMLNLVGTILFVPVVLALMHLLRERSTVLSHLGGALALIGLLGWAAHWARYFGLMSAAATGPVDRSEIVALMEAWMTTADTVVYVLMFVLASFLGMILLAIGLVRVRATPRPAAVAFLAGWAGWLLVAFTPLAESALAIGAVWAVITVGLGLTGIALLRSTDATWERLSATLPEPA